MTATPPSAPVLSEFKRRGFPRMQELGLIVVIILVSIALWAGSGTIQSLNAKTVPDGHGGTMLLPMRDVHVNGFLRPENIFNSILRDMSWMAIMAIGQTIVIISGGIDISVGSIMCLSSFVAAIVLQRFPVNAPAWQVIPVGLGVPLAVGALCGLINGLLVVGLRMHPFIVTLATLSIFHWGPLKLAKFFGGNSQPFGDRVLPDWFFSKFIGWDYIRPVFGGQASERIAVYPTLAMLLCLVVGWFYLRHTIWGRETYAVGGNEEAARFSGIRVNWVKVRVYLFSGLSAGIAGMLLLGYEGASSTVTGQGYELTVIAAAVVGGASLTGGRGTALGAVLGMLVLQLILDGIFVVGHINLGIVKIPVEKEDTDLIYGLCIVVAVAVDQFSMLLQSRRSAALHSAH